MMANKRKERDIAKLTQRSFKVDRSGGANELEVEFSGPADTFYEGGQWRVRVHLPANYPFQSPSLGFVNKIFHPNVDFQLAKQQWFDLSRRD